MGLIQSRFVRSPLVHGGGLMTPAAAGLTMAGSIVFNGSNEDLRIASFSSSSPNRKTFTISFWARFDDPNSDNLFVFRTNDDNEFGIARDDDFGVLIAFDLSGGSFQYFGDFGPSDVATATWEHWVLAVDTTQGTVGNRVRVYRDGAEQSVSASEFSQNDDAHVFVNGAAAYIGAHPSFEDFDGRLADFIVVEGQQLAPSEFGYNNGGTWSWKDYEGSFGTYGFRINPQDSSQIGTDQSGNGNNFTLTNMDTSNFDAASVPPV